MAQTIQLFRTTTNNPPPAVMPQGQIAVGISPTATRMWLSDGAANRLLFSTDPADNPILTALYLELAGGVMTGQIVQPALPTLNPHLANKLYVDTAIAAYSVYRGTYQIAANIPAAPPSPSAGDTVNGANYICITASGLAGSTEATTVALPGIPSGTIIRHGDRIIWVEPADVWQIIRGGQLDITAADGRYVNITGDAMTGALNMGANPVVITAAPATPDEATNKLYVDTELNAYLPLLGGTLLGDLAMSAGTFITLPDPPAIATDAVNKAYVDTIPRTTIADQVSIVGDGTATGPLPAGPLTVDIVDGGTF